MRVTFDRGVDIWSLQTYGTLTASHSATSLYIINVTALKHTTMLVGAQIDYICLISYLQNMLTIYLKKDLCDMLLERGEYNNSDINPNHNYSGKDFNIYEINSLKTDQSINGELVQSLSNSISHFAEVISNFKILFICKQLE